MYAPCTELYLSVFESQLAICGITIFLLEFSVASIHFADVPTAFYLMIFLVSMFLLGFPIKFY